MFWLPGLCYSDRSQTATQEDQTWVVFGFEKQRDEHVRNSNSTENIRRESCLPELTFGWYVLRKDGGVVDEDIESAVFGFDLIEGIADRRVTGNVEFDCRKYIFCIGRFGERRDRLFHLLEGAATDDDMVFLRRLGEQTSGPVTNPSVGTCDKCVVREGKFYCMKRGVLFRTSDQNYLLQWCHVRIPGRTFLLSLSCCVTSCPRDCWRALGWKEKAGERFQGGLK